MSEMIAICGLKCHECGAFLATRDNDDDKRGEVARTWSKMFEIEIQPSDINCEGCTSDGDVRFQHCTVCEIRKCGMERGLVNCAHCDDYACGKLEEFFETVPDCRTQLDGVRAGLQGTRTRPTEDEDASVLQGTRTRPTEDEDASVLQGTRTRPTDDEDASVLQGTRTRPTDDEDASTMGGVEDSAKESIPKDASTMGGVEDSAKENIPKSEQALRDAFAGESQANRKYLAYAEKADAEGYFQVGRLFRAAAAAETVHAHNHLRALGAIGTTEENLKDAIAGETHEFKTMYPEMIELAKAEGNKEALRSFELASTVEKTHAELYAGLLATLGFEQGDFPHYVCPVCGHTVGKSAPDICPVCGTAGGVFKKIH